MRLNIDTNHCPSSIRIGFTDQRLTAHGGLVVWSQCLHQQHFRQQLQQALPHSPTSPNAFAQTDIALGELGGVLSGTDPAVAEVLGIEAVPSQSTLSRFFAEFDQHTSSALSALHTRAVFALPSRREGDTLDLDAGARLHEDGHQDGVAVGYTRHGLKPCHRPLLAALAEEKLVANDWLRRGDMACGNGAAEFLRQTMASLPAHIRVGLVRGDAGCGSTGVQEAAAALGLKFIFAARLTQKVQAVWRHD